MYRVTKSKVWIRRQRSSIRRKQPNTTFNELYFCYKNNTKSEQDFFYFCMSNCDTINVAPL
jgi:hypothetical protein